MATRSDFARAAALTALLLAPAASLCAPAAEGWAKMGTGEIAVSSSAELLRALGAVKPGQAIVLEPGVYGRLSIKGMRNAAPVVIRSRDPGRPAQLVGADIIESENIWLQQLVLGPGPRPDGDGKGTGYVVEVRDSRLIGVVMSIITGTPDGNFANDPEGASFHKSDDIVFAANDVHDVGRGVVVSAARRVRIADNRFTDIRSDGADFAGVQEVEIDHNTFSTFHPIEPDHPDYIQFWTQGALIDDTHTVFIHHNVMVQGNGTFESPQGIFMRSEVSGWVYRSVRIENNIVYNASRHGISLYDVVGGRVANNTVVMAPIKGDVPHINMVGSRDIEVVDNVTPGISQERSQQIRLDNNIQTKAAAVGNAIHPEALFVDPAAGPGATAASFMPLPTSRLVGANGRVVGALPALGPGWRSEVAIVAKTPSSPARRGLEVELDARANDDAQAGPATYHWDFGDQTTGEGPVVQHRYAQPGVYAVKLTVRRGATVVNGIKHIQVGVVALQFAPFDPGVRHG